MGRLTKKGTMIGTLDIRRGHSVCVQSDPDFGLPFPKARDILPVVDLSRVRKKLMLIPPQGKGWTDEQASEGIMWYRRFLYLCKKYPRVGLAPNRMIDAVWHYHILDTHNYARDCERIFGHFLHHRPFEGEEKAKVDMGALYLKEFGKDTASENSVCSSVCDTCSPD